MDRSIIRTIDSHTEGEPTRVLISGLPALNATTMMARREELREKYDYLRTAIASEPRAPEGTVVAFLTDAVSDGSSAGVIFANRSAYLGMCGHGAIGVVQTLVYQNALAEDRMEISLDTPAGTVSARRFHDGSSEVENVHSYAHRMSVEVDVPAIGTLLGDIAYGGNWFFLVDAAAVGIRLELSNAPVLAQVTLQIRDALRRHGITGTNGAEIDHVELFSAPTRSDADSKNFVLCPDGAYDRSPCGTGTSAKMAVLAACGKLKPGDVWRQESFTGSLFTGRIEQRDGKLIPFVRGRAHITGETTLHFDPNDPLRWGRA